MARAPATELTLKWIRDGLVLVLNSGFMRLALIWLLWTIVQLTLCVSCLDLTRRCVVLCMVVVLGSGRDLDVVMVNGVVSSMMVHVSVVMVCWYLRG